MQADEGRWYSQDQMRVLLVTNIIAPYRISTWDELGKKVGQFHVVACAETAKNRIWGVDDLQDLHFSCQILRGVSLFILNRDWAIHWNLRLWQTLNEFGPEAIIVGGYNSPSLLIAMLYSKLKKIPLIMWWGSHSLSSRTKSGPIALFRKCIVKLCDSYVTYGSMASQYLTSFGVSEERICTGINCVDVKKIEQLTTGYKKDADSKRSGRAKLLYVGQLLERKGIMNLLRAFEGIPEEEAELTIVGYGPLEKSIKNYIAASGLKNVHFAGGTKSIRCTAKFYAGADILVMPSHLEVWGLVVNEALASGLYVLASERAGSTEDLIRKAPVSVGNTINSDSITDIREKILQAVRDRQSIDRAAIRRWGCAQTPRKYAESIVSAIGLAERWAKAR